MSMIGAILRESAGMTVAEVMISIGIITVGLLSLLAAMPLSTSGIAESNLKTTATFLVQQRLEQIKTATWTTVPATDEIGGAGSDGTAAIAQWPDEGYGTIGFPGAAACAGDRSGGCRFRRQVRIMDCSVVGCSGVPTGTTAANTLRQVTVTVFFSGVSGAGTTAPGEEAVQIITLIARRP
jgi:hypothetical protein